MAELTYAEPVKRINAEADVDSFKHSLAYERLHSVIAFLVEKVHNCDVPTGFLDPQYVTRDATADSSPSKADLKAETSQFSKSGVILFDVFRQLNALIDDTPPLEGPRRFGNMACRDWHRKMRARSSDMLSALSLGDGAKLELNHYLVNSFGSELRLDFGSGHELSFLAFIGGLLQTDSLPTDVSGAEILALFAQYYDLTRRLILVYNLEPAGSHGVWGLDDHFHFIYILGASEYATGPKENPVSYVPPVRSTLSPEVTRAYKLSNLYMNAISFIFKLKVGPFNEHSPIIYDITRSVSLWTKVQSGLLKMYEVEVLGKFPVVQHFWFGGKLFPWVDARTHRELSTAAVETEKPTTAQTENEPPGLINSFQGTNTTKSNIAITRAPWANSRVPTVPTRNLAEGRQKSSVFQSPRPRNPQT